MFAILVLSLNLHASDIPKASDFDFEPEKVFTEYSSISPQYDNLTIKTKSDLSTHNLNYTVDYTTNIQITDWDATKALDWTIINELNLKAHAAWNNLVKHTGSEENAKKAYLTANIPSKAKEEIKNFRDSVRAYLVTAEINQFNISNYLKCAPKCGLYFSQNSIDQFRILSGFYPKQKDDYFNKQMNPFLKVISTLPEVPYSPLLLQTIFEHIANGYPINYGLAICKGAMALRCALSGRLGTYQIWDTDQPEYTARGLGENLSYVAKQKKLIESAEALEQLGALPEFQEREWAVKFELIRAAKTGVRILNHMMMGVKQCAALGLDPKKSIDLLGVLAQSQYNLGQISIESTDLDFTAMQMSVLCQHNIDYTILRPGASNNPYIPIDENNTLGNNTIYRVAEIGGWRELYRRLKK